MDLCTRCRHLFDGVEAFTIHRWDTWPVTHGLSIRHPMILLDNMSGESDGLTELQADAQNERVKGQKASSLAQHEARIRAQKFVDAIVDDDAYLNIGDGTNMMYLPSLVDLETGASGPLVLSTITNDFWDACIRRLNMSYRVAAVGSPGLGKTASTPVLIRKLLKQGNTVVYLIRSIDKENWFYEFIPEGGRFRAAVYPEKGGRESVPSLDFTSTYYIVNPGETTDSCDPEGFQAKVLIVASSDDEGHWGGSSFTNRLDTREGVFQYYPMWSEEELLAVKDILRPDMDEEAFFERLRQFGNVPGRIFCSDAEAKKFLDDQKRALDALTYPEVLEILKGTFDGVGSFRPGLPKSAFLTLSPISKDRSIPESDADEE
jgi:hypothetical protein